MMVRGWRPRNTLVPLSEAFSSTFLQQRALITQPQPFRCTPARQLSPILGGWHRRHPIQMCAVHNHLYGSCVLPDVLATVHSTLRQWCMS